MDDFKKFSFWKRKILKVEFKEELIESSPNSIQNLMSRSPAVDLLIRLTLFLAFGCE